LDFILFDDWDLKATAVPRAEATKDFTQAGDLKEKLSGTGCLKTTAGRKESSDIATAV
jgi:hypothetical protein